MFGGGQIEQIRVIRSSIVHLFVFAVGLAAGVNLIVEGIVQRLAFQGTAEAVLGLFLVFSAFTFLVIRSIPSLSKKWSIKGVLPISKNQNAVVEIDRYEFSEKSKSFIVALGLENEALRKTWAEYPLYEYKVDVKTNRTDLHHSPTAALAREAIEYFVLDLLSLHLSEHFNDDELTHDEIITLRRKDIPSVLLDNHFLELFSKPMEERSAFSREPGSHPDHNVVFAICGNGAIFDQFELRLPKRSVVSRLSANRIKIETQRFSMEIDCSLDGCRTMFPREFEELYLGLNFDDVTPYIVAIDVAVKFKLRSLITPSGWEYFEWIDSFISELNENISFERFLERIGWDLAVSTIKISRHQNRNKLAQRPRGSTRN